MSERAPTSSLALKNLSSDVSSRLQRSSGIDAALAQLDEVDVPIKKSTLRNRARRHRQVLRKRNARDLQSVSETSEAQVPQHTPVSGHVEESVPPPQACPDNVVMCDMTLYLVNTLGFTGHRHQPIFSWFILLVNFLTFGYFAETLVHRHEEAWLAYSLGFKRRAIVRVDPSEYHRVLHKMQGMSVTVNGAHSIVYQANSMGITDPIIPMLVGQRLMFDKVRMQSCGFTEPIISGISGLNSSAPLYAPASLRVYTTLLWNFVLVTCIMVCLWALMPYLAMLSNVANSQFKHSGLLITRVASGHIRQFSAQLHAIVGWCWDTTVLTWQHPLIGYFTRSKPRGVRRVSVTIARWIFSKDPSLGESYTKYATDLTLQCAFGRVPDHTGTRCVYTP